MDRTTPMTEEEILICEFMDIKFQARKDNSGYNRVFDTHQECLDWINELKLKMKEKMEGYIPLPEPLGYVQDYAGDMTALYHVIIKIADLSGYELVMGYSYSYWNNSGEQPLPESGGYENVANICAQVIAFIRWHNGSTD